MTALLVSVIVWGIVAFMASDDYCRTREINALRFFSGVGVILTLVGLWNFELHDVRQVSVSDWLLVGLFPILLVYLWLKTKLSQFQATGDKDSPPPEGSYSTGIPERGLVKRLRIVRLLMWAWAAVALVANLLSGITI